MNHETNLRTSADVVIIVVSIFSSRKQLTKALSHFSLVFDNQLFGVVVVAAGATECVTD